MSLIENLFELKFVDAQLTAAVKGKGPVRRTVALLRRSTDLRDRIENWKPRDLGELQDMIVFFTKRSATHVRADAGRRDLDIALKLSARMNDPTLSPRPSAAMATTAIPALRSDTISPEVLSRYVHRSPGRVSAVDRSYRYLAVSPMEAEFNRSTPIQMIDRDMSEFVGREVFRTRVNGALDQCFSGEAVSYSYRLRDPMAGESFIECHMTPISDPHGSVYCALLHEYPQARPSEASRAGTVGS